MLFLLKLSLVDIIIQYLQAAMTSTKPHYMLPVTSQPITVGFN
jgi:hypothetical protein